MEKDFLDEIVEEVERRKTPASHRWSMLLSGLGTSSGRSRSADGLGRSQLLHALAGRAAQALGSRGTG